MTAGLKSRALTSSQRRTIFWQCKKLGLSDDERRLVQLAVADKPSLAEFTFAEGKELIEELKKRGAKPRRARTKPRKLPDNVEQLITSGQRTMLERLASQVAWREEDGFARWMLSSFGFSCPRTNKEVTLVKHGLHSLIDQQRKRRGA